MQNVRILLIRKLNHFYLGHLHLYYKEKKSNLSNLVYLDLQTIGVRIPSHNFPLKIVENFKKPIITTSVNAHKKKPLNNFEEIKNEFQDIVIFIDNKLKYNSKGSTIIDCTSEKFSLLRMGDGIFQ